MLIKQNNNLKGIIIGETEYKVSQFANDTIILLEEQSVETALGILNLFANMSGLKIDKNKTRAIWIGSQKFSAETFNHRFKLDWSQGSFTILRIKFSCNLDEMVDLNFKDKIN